MARQATISLPSLYSRQIHVRNTSRRFNVVDCGRRWGKNVLAHDLIVRTVLAGKPAAWGSPTYKNLADDWRTLADVLSPVVAGKSEQEKRLDVVTGGRVEMWSLDNPEPIRGRAYQRFVFNEAAQVRQLMGIWNEIVRPTLIDYKGDAYWFSTPKGLNDFHQLHVMGRNGDSEWRSFGPYTSYDNPHIDPAELDDMRRTMPEREYRQEILAQFLESEGVVFRNIDACMHAKATTPEEHADHVLVAGVDWGKANDFTAISIGCATCRQEVELVHFNQIDYYFQMGRVTRVFDEWGVELAEIEYNSIGGPNFETLIHRGYPVVAYEANNVRNAALIDTMALEMERTNIQFLPNDVARGELEAFEMKTTPGLKLPKYEAPEGLHDDTVRARALMIRAMNEVNVDYEEPNPQVEAYANWLNQHI